MTRTRLALAWLLVASLAATPAGAVEALPDTVEAFDRVYAAWMRKHGVERGSLAVAREDRLVLVRGYGGRRGEERTLLASLSKAITAVCVATLVGAGRLSFTTPVGQVLDQSFGDPRDRRVPGITVEQLLTHRAGFGDGHGGDPATGETLAGLLRERGPHAATSRELWRRTIRFELQSAPGQVYRYTNVAYLALGMIIEALSGRPYEEQCAPAVLEPLGIREPGLDPTWRILGPFGGWRLSGPEYLAFLKVFGPGGPVLDGERRRWLETTEGRETDGSRRVFYTLGMLLRPVAGGGYNLFHSGGWEYNLPGAPGGSLRASLGTFAVRAAFGASWFVSYEPRPSGAARQELDRELWRAALAIRVWPAEDQFPRFGLR